MEAILLLGGLGALLFWLTSGKQAADGGGGVRTTTTPDLSDTAKESGAPAAVQTTDAYATGVAVGRLDAGDSMDAAIKSGKQCGPMLHTRFDSKKEANWQQGYRDGFTGTLTDHGWSGDGTNVCAPAPPVTVDNSAEVWESGKAAGAYDAHVTLDAGEVNQPKWDSSSMNTNATWRSGYSNGYNNTLAASGYAVDDSGNLYALEGEGGEEPSSTDWMGDSL
jgi:hypothetical protein